MVRRVNRERNIWRCLVWWVLTLGWGISLRIEYLPRDFAMDF